MYADLGLKGYFYPFFIGDGRTRLFYITSWGQTASLYQPNEDILARYENLLELTKLVRVENVATKRLDDVVKDVDLLKLDVQGAEYDILSNAERLLSEALVVWVEVEFVPLYINQPLFSDIDSLLRKHGFQFFSFDYFGTRKLKNSNNTPRNRRYQQLWADAIYIRDISSWERLNTVKLCKLAVLLEWLGAFDHVYYLLKLLSQRGINVLNKYQKGYYLPGAIELVCEVTVND